MPEEPAGVKSETPTSEKEGREARDERSAEDRRFDDRLGGDGLPSEEARARLERYGPNAIEEEARSVVREFLSHFWGPIPWMIEAALLLTAATAKWVDFAVILVLLLMNGVVGFWEEHQAQTVIAALKERLAKEARVKRDGEWGTVRAEEIVPGDLVAVGRTAVVPADGRILEGTAEADESTLTGESLPVAKEPGLSLFSGSSIVRGESVMRVLATGAKTEFGRTAALAGEEQRASHFQQAVISIGKYLIVVALVLVSVIVTVSLLRGENAAHTLEFALVVTIASIPVALPAVLSVTMAIGARHLAKGEAVVSHLPAVEEMAGVDILCADKTGTITKNEIAVADVRVLNEHENADSVLLEAALTVEHGGKDPIDAAILERIGGDGVLGRYQIVDFEPFDATRKRADARVRDSDGSEFRVAKGAVQAILELSGDSGMTDRVSRVTSAFAEKGYRALAVARTDDGGDWRLTGVIGLQDPPRDDSRETLEEAARLGLEIKMVTGDRVEIAREISTEVGLGDEILESGTIQGLKGEQLVRKIDEADGFAQVVPEDKYRIVQALQERDHIVGMTGDGVNDAPALRRADAGIAVAGATDAARAAADIVFLAPGLSMIVEAVHRAREVFRRMKNYAIYRLTETIRVVFAVTVAIIAFSFFPVTPIQIVLLAVLNDAAILSIAYDRVEASRKPERWDLREVLTVAAVLGGIGIIETTGIIWLAQGPLALSEVTVQTLVYLKLSVAGHMTVFVARTHRRLWSHRPSWILLGAVVGTQILATLIAGFGFLMHALPWQYVALAWGYAAVWALILDQAKLFTYGIMERRGEVAPELGEA